MTCLGLSDKEISRIKTAMAKSQKRISGSLEGNFEYHHMAIGRSDRFLRKHDSERMKMFVLFADLGESTKMSSELSPEVLAKIIRIYSQEMAYVVEYYGGYVLKYVGDAVIGYFPASEHSVGIARKTVLCGQTMVSVIDCIVNPIIVGEGYKPRKIKISVDFGRNSIVRYGSNRKKSYIDIIGLSVNLAAKMQTLGRPNQMVVGKNVYVRLPSKMKSCFRKLAASSKVWPYHDFIRRTPYGVFSSQLSTGSRYCK